MMKFDFRRANFKGPTAIMRLGFAISAITLAISTSSVSLAASKATINRDAKATLDKLYKNNPGAKALGDKSVGVLVFPSIVKGGFIIAGQFGDGAFA
jgi:lipid-binding SYLF domain-containing protein